MALLEQNLFACFSFLPHAYPTHPPLVMPIHSLTLPPIFHSSPWGSPVVILHCYAFSFLNKLSQCQSGLFPAVKDPASAMVIREHGVKKMLLGTPLVLSQQPPPLPQHSHTGSPDPQPFLTLCPTPSPSWQAAHPSLPPQSHPLVPALLPSTAVTHLCRSFPWGTGWHCTAPVLCKNPSQPHTGGSPRHSAAQRQSTLQGPPSSRRGDTSEETLVF